jgi:hypothetical protein
VSEFGPTGELSNVLPREVYSDPADVVVALDNIAEELTDAGLVHLLPFNTIYRELTAGVIEAIGNGEFQDPETVARTIGIFADYYFKQLRAHTRLTDEVVDPAWRLLFYDEEAKNAPPGVQFLLGMNAHINYDLPQALRDSNVEDSYYDDYKRVVGILIELTAKKIAPDYIPGPEFSRNGLIDMTLNLIANWREHAWQTGKALLVVKRHKEAEMATSEWIPGDTTAGDVAINAIMRHIDKESVWYGKNFILGVGRRALSGLISVSELATFFGDVWQGRAA